MPWPLASMPPGMPGTHPLQYFGWGTSIGISPLLLHNLDLALQNSAKWHFEITKQINFSGGGITPSPYLTLFSISSSLPWTRSRTLTPLAMAGCLWLSVRPSLCVTLKYRGHIGWNCSKIILSCHHHHHHGEDRSRPERPLYPRNRRKITNTCYIILQ